MDSHQDLARIVRQLAAVSERVLALTIFLGVMVFSVCSVLVLVRADWSQPEAIYDLTYRMLLAVIGLELVRTLLTHDLEAVLELLAFVVARKTLKPDLPVTDIFLSVLAFSVLFVVRHVVRSREASVAASAGGRGAAPAEAAPGDFAGEGGARHGRSAGGAAGGLPGRAASGRALSLGLVALAVAALAVGLAVAPSRVATAEPAVTQPSFAPARFGVPASRGIPSARERGRPLAVASAASRWPASESRQAPGPAGAIDVNRAAIRPAGLEKPTVTPRPAGSTGLGGLGSGPSRIGLKAPRLPTELAGRIGVAVLGSAVATLPPVLPSGLAGSLAGSIGSAAMPVLAGMSGTSGSAASDAAVRLGGLAGLVATWRALPRPAAAAAIAQFLQSPPPRELTGAWAELTMLVPPPVLASLSSPAAASAAAEAVAQWLQGGTVPAEWAGAGWQPPSLPPGLAPAISRVDDASVSAALASAARNLLGFGDPSGRGRSVGAGGANPAGTDASPTAAASVPVKPPRVEGRLMAGTASPPDFTQWDFPDPGVGTQPETVITANHCAFLGKMAELTGSVRVTRGDDLLTCKRALVKDKPQWMLASGEPRLYRRERIEASATTREITIDAGTMVWDSVTRMLTASPGVVAHLEERTWDLATHSWLTITSERLEGWPDRRELHFLDAVTIRDKDSFGRGRRLVYDQQGHAVNLWGDAMLETMVYDEKKRTREKRVLQGASITYNLNDKTTYSE